MSDKPLQDPFGVAVAIVSEWQASETRINLAFSKRESLWAHIAAALRQRDEAAAVAVAKANGRGDALQERVYQLAAFIDSRHIGYDRRCGVYRCQDCGAHAPQKRNIAHSSRCLVGRFTAWQEEAANV